MERNMEFIVEHQAKFTVDIDRINETLAKHSEAIAGLLQVSRTLIDHQTALDERMAELAAAGKETEERLNAFIAFVEKYISGRNGGKN